MDTTIDAYELISNMKWAPSTGEIKLEPLPVGSQVNIIQKKMFVTDRAGKLLVKRNEDIQVFANLLNHALEIWVKPEVERRKKAEIPISFPLEKFIVLFDTPEGTPPTIKFNDEYNLGGHFQLKPTLSVKEGDSIVFDMIADINSIIPPTVNGEPVGYFIFNQKGAKIAVCMNFRPGNPDFDRNEWNEEGKWLARFYLENILAYEFGHLILIVPELSRYDIPFTFGLKSTKMAKICELIKSGNTRQLLDDKILEIITDEDIISLFDNWTTFQYINNRNDILAEVKKAFEYELYGCVVTLLMSQIEGVITDKLVQEGMGLRDDGEAYRWKNRRKEFDELIRNKYKVGVLTLKLLDNFSFFMEESNLYKPQIWASSTERLSRPGSLHGMDVGFNTRANAIRMILLFDGLYWILLAMFLSNKG